MPPIKGLACARLGMSKMTQLLKNKTRRIAMKSLGVMKEVSGPSLAKRKKPKKKDFIPQEMIKPRPYRCRL